MLGGKILLPFPQIVDHITALVLCKHSAMIQVTSFSEKEVLIEKLLKSSNSKEQL